MSEKSEALIGLIDGYTAGKNRLPANAIKEELKRVKVIENELIECINLLSCAETCSRNNFQNLAMEQIGVINKLIKKGANHV